MVAVFLIVLGIVGGFFLAIVVREWLKACEARQQAKVKRQRLKELKRK